MALADDPCKAVVGAAGDYCRNGKTGPGTGSGDGVLDSVDPLHQVSQQVANAADWTARHLGDVVLNRSATDFTNQGFLQQYAVVFAASTILTLILWLLAVAKRAVRGVPMGTALGEAVGLLWVAVMACAFTPLVLYTVINAVGAVTEVIAGATGANPNGVFGELGGNLKNGKVGGGPIVLIIASALTIALCGALWLLMVLRALSLYVGAILGVVVYSGAVDKDMWGHIRRWASLMVGLIMIEPIVVIILGLASALESSGDNGPVATGLVISAAALGAAIFVISKFPGLGDSMKAARLVGKAAGGAAGAIAGPRAAATSPATGVAAGIATHGDRSSRVNGTARPSNPVTGGIAAHGDRAPKPPKSEDDK
ncbi:hypothetical protein [Streptomyces sp. NRRL F-5123]|uniref:hypothetical protein n=1 Tax=Streptomyces sp. NRRL F-5123 TaxID=1463856 RepID=UPI0006950737|nr:hypothetical protein [Streptomyces sp. NRRL F-5123]